MFFILLVFRILVFCYWDITYYLFLSLISFFLKLNLLYILQWINKILSGHEIYELILKYDNNNNGNAVTCLISKFINLSNFYNTR